MQVPPSKWALSFEGFMMKTDHFTLVRGMHAMSKTS
jgi:hypothetical protein